MTAHGRSLELKKIGPRRPVFLTSSRPVGPKEDRRLVSHHSYDQAELNLSRDLVARQDAKNLTKAKSAWTKRHAAAKPTTRGRLKALLGR